MDTDFDLTSEERAQQYRTLLEVSESIAAYRDLPICFMKSLKACTAWSASRTGG